jgi:Fe-S cluster assembly protein SufD
MGTEMETGMATMTDIETETRGAAEPAATTAPWLADIERFQRELPAGEPAAVQALRRLAAERFATLGFPTLQQEAWRLTNVAPIARGVFTRPTGALEADPALLARHSFEATARLVFVDGRFAPALSQLDGLPSGVIAGSLAQTVESGAGALEHLGQLGQPMGAERNPFVALNTAFLHDGAFLSVPRGVVVPGTVHLLFLSSPGADGQATASFPRNLIVAGEQSQLSVVETYAGTGAYFTCPVTELVAGPSSVVDHYKVQHESREAFHVATFQLLADRGSAPSSHSISIGGALVRNDVNAVLGGEGVDCILNGLYLAEGRQHVDNHMRVEHAKAHCASHELYKGVLDGKAKTVFDGLIYVHHGAQKTDAKQSNRNLLLSRDAIANSNPRLEIFADDVKCTHGSTVGQLDDDAIFYLRSRGIGEEAARSLLTYAFASDIVERIKVDPVRHDLSELLFSRLPQGEVVRQAV